MECALAVSRFAGPSFPLQLPFLLGWSALRSMRVVRFNPIPGSLRFHCRYARHDYLSCVFAAGRTEATYHPFVSRTNVWLVRNVSSCGPLPGRPRAKTMGTRICNTSFEIAATRNGDMSGSEIIEFVERVTLTSLAFSAGLGRSPRGSRRGILLNLTAAGAALGARAFRFLRSSPPNTCAYPRLVRRDRRTGEWGLRH